MSVPQLYVPPTAANQSEWIRKAASAINWLLGNSGTGTGGGGTVTSVALTAPTGFTVTGSPITNSGTLAITTSLSGYVKGNGSGFTAAATVPVADITGLAAVATSGAYSSLTGTPTLAAIATSGSAADLSAGTVPAARMPAHTGDVTSTVGTVALTIANSTVTLAKMADVATGTVFYRKTAATGAPEVQTLATLKADLGLTGTNSGDQIVPVNTTATASQFFTAYNSATGAFTKAQPAFTDLTGSVAASQMPALTGDVTTTAGTVATTIAAGAVSLAKMANVATGTVFYRKTAGTGAPEVQTLATLKTDLGLTGTNSGDQTITLTGDMTGSGTGSFATTLATVNANVGTFGSSTLVPVITVNGKGLITAVTTAAVSGGGGGAPGGSTTQIQFNNAGAFGGDADFTWDSTTNDLVLGGTDTGITLAGITTEPSAPASGSLHYYAKSVAGRMIPKVKGPSGLDYGLQASLWQNNIVMWTPTTATAGVWLGTAGAGAGTYTTALPTTTNVYTSQKRGRWANVVTTLNQVLGQRNTEAMFFRGNAAGQGGWFFFARAGFDVWTNGGRFFAGMHSATTVVSADPSALNNTVGFCVNAADNGAISFLTRDGTTATKAATGFTIVSNKGYDLFFWCAPNSSSIGWRIIDLAAGTEASGTATATLPVNTTLLTAGVLASNAALTPVTSIQLGLNKIYVETDY